MCFRPLLDSLVHTELVLNEFLLVRERDEVLEFHPLLDVCFSFTYNARLISILQGLIACLENNHDIFGHLRVEITAVVPLIRVNWAKQVLPVVFQIVNSLLGLVEQGLARVGSIAPIEVLARAVTSGNLKELSFASWCPLLVIELKRTNIGWNACVVLTIWTDGNPCSNGKALVVVEPFRLKVEVVELTNLHLVVLVAE